VKDRLGRDLKIGDRVAFASDPLTGPAILALGEVFDIIVGTERAHVQITTPTNTMRELIGHPEVLPYRILIIPPEE
jgi:hypothetical protein